jgi:hypothetical protein
MSANEGGQGAKKEVGKQLPVVRMCVGSAAEAKETGCTSEQVQRGQGKLSNAAERQN